MARGRARPHRAGVKGYISYPLENEEDAPAVLAILGRNYDRAKATPRRARRGKIRRSKRGDYGRALEFGASVAPLADPPDFVEQVVVAADRWAWISWGYRTTRTSVDSWTRGPLSLPSYRSPTASASSPTSPAYPCVPCRAREGRREHRRALGRPRGGWSRRGRLLGGDRGDGWPEEYPRRGRALGRRGYKGDAPGVERGALRAFRR